jgi:hypothetical protein
MKNRKGWFENYSYNFRFLETLHISPIYLHNFIFTGGTDPLPPASYAYGTNPV